MPSSRSDRDFLKELKRKDKKRRKLKKRRRHRSESSSDSSDSEGSDLDLSKEMYPISHYVNDREEMIAQVFSVIKGNKLRSMLPPFLADLEIEEVKALCLEQVTIKYNQIRGLMSIKIILLQLIGMSKKRVLCTIAGQEMVDSSDTEDDDISDSEVLNANKKKVEVNEDQEEVDSEEEKKKNRGESSVSNDPQAATNLKKVHKIKISKKDANKIVLKGGERKKKEKDSGKNEDVGEEKGKTLMELLELEMRARAIKALLMKAGKDEGEAESLAIEEALDEQKKKQENGQALVEKASSMKAKPLRQRGNSDEEEEEKDENDKEDDEEEEEGEGEEVERVFNSQTSAMSKARDALMVSENKKMIEDEVKARKEDEAKFMYEEQLRKEREEKEKIERDKLVKEVRAMKQKVIEEEQEQRRLKIEAERDKMRRDHERKEQLKQQKDKDKLFSKIAAMKDEEQKEKDALEEHYKTKFAKKNDDEEDMVLDDDEAQKMRSYRRKEGNESDDNRSRSRSRSYSSSPQRRRPYSRSSDEDSGKRRGGKTRLKRKIADGSDVEDGEVEEVDSDAEDEIEREEDQQNLLEKMKNLKKKFSEMEEKKTEEAQGSGPSSPQPQPSSRGRGRGRGGRGRGRGRGKPVNEEDEEWSMQKYDFEAPDIQEALEGHKPNFVKPEKRVFEKGYYSEEEKKEDGAEAEKPKKDDSGFKKVSRDEWNKMSKAEKKKYLKERKKWRLSQTVYIKDDSDNEQLTDEDNDDDEDDLKYSESEGEEEKQERLAREALKSYAGAFKKDDDPEDYSLVMRKDVVEKELADTEDSKYETAEDIEFREKRERLETKELERKAKMREERLKRMQAFQASSILREEPQEEEQEEDEEEEAEEKQPEAMEEDQFDVEVTTETKPVDENPFYSSYEALEKKDELEDPLKEERERIKAEQEKDEAELRKIKESKTPVPVFEAVEEEDKVTAPPTKKPKIEIGQMSLGALKSMIDSEREKVQKEMEDMEEKTRQKEQEEEHKKKKAEQVLRRAKRRGDANNPSKEEVDAAQELEQMTWQDRYMKNRKVKDVVEKSQLLSKVKNKLKEDKKEKVTEVAPGANEPAMASSSSNAEEDTAKEAEKEGSMIGSIEEYASLVGKSVSRLAETKYEAPELEPSDEEDEDSDGDGDDLWGAIMGGN